MTVIELWRHPVKSMQGEQLDTAEIVADGLAADRTWAVQDTTTGKVLTARREPRLLHASARLGADGSPELTLPGHTGICTPGDAADRALSDWLDRPVRLVQASMVSGATAEMFADSTDDTSEVLAWTMPAGRHVDVYPLSLLTTASLRAGAATHPHGAWHSRRFRANLVIDVPGTGWLEDRWQGKTVRIGGAEIDVARPAVRCTMITRSQPGLGHDVDMFRAVARAHGGTLAVWATVRTPGTIRLGDRVELA